MRETVGDIFTDFVQPDAIVITTNGDINTAGGLIMGAGIAKDARARFPGLDVALGTLVKEKGNVVNLVKTKDLIGNPATIVSLPTKHSFKDEYSDLALIMRGLVQLVIMANEMKWSEVVMPRPGALNGKLDFNTQVRPLCESFLDDRFIVVEKDAN